MAKGKDITVRLGAALLASVALLSCSKSGGSKAFDDGPSATDFTITPGQYETTFRITKASLEGLPKQMQDELTRAQANPQTQRGCMPVGFSLGSASVKNLRYSFQKYGGCNIGDISQDGGMLHGALNCEIKNLPQDKPDTPKALSINADWSGTYSANTWNAKMHAEFNEPGGSRRGSGDMEISVRRVGDCPSGSNPFQSSMPPAPPPVESSGSSTTP